MPRRGTHALLVHARGAIVTPLTHGGDAESGRIRGGSDGMDERSSVSRSGGGGDGGGCDACGAEGEVE